MKQSAGFSGRVGLAIVVLPFLLAASWAADLQGPDRIAAGQGIALQTSGSGSATLYISGPGTAIKRNIKLGDAVSIAPEDLRNEGRYVASLGDAGSTKVFFVTSNAPASVTFLARPSRVPAATADAISGVAFVYDQYKNLVPDPTHVRFVLSVDGKAFAEQSIVSNDSVAYLTTSSPNRAGVAQFTASLAESGSAPPPDSLVRRVVTLTAGEPCNLHISVHREGKFLLVQTDSIKDCSGNPVPDGTIVTFTETEAGTGWRSQVDARIKRGVAKAQLPLSNDATVSVASGIKLGNEIHVAGGA